MLKGLYGVWNITRDISAFHVRAETGAEGSPTGHRSALGSGDQNRERRLKPQFGHNVGLQAPNQCPISVGTK